MKIAEFTNQKVKKDKLDKDLVDFVTVMQQWLPIWQRLSPEQQAGWLASGKSPLINTGHDLYLLLDQFFGGK